MVSKAVAAVGKRRYALGTKNSPQGGRTLKPAGYIKREVKKRMAIKKPQRRSGLAAAALRRKVAAKKPVIKKPAPPKPVAAAAPKPVTAAAAPVSNAPAAPATPAQPVVPTVKINENGQLDLPYDATFSADMLKQQEDMNAQLMDLQQQNQAENLQATQDKRNLDQDYTKIKRQTINSAAGRGVAFSSGYGNAVANNATEYSNQSGDIAARQAQSNDAFRNNQNAIQNAFNAYLRQAMFARGTDLEQQAGSLGYGQSTATPMATPAAPKNPIQKVVTKPKPKPKPKKKVALKKKAPAKKVTHPLKKQAAKNVKKAAAKKLIKKR